MSRIENFYIAAFRGFQFPVESDSTTRGQKLALHEYPNRDTRYAESLGKLPPVLNLVCLIHGENFFAKRQEFERLLEIPGVGELVHPYYGSIKVQVGEFTIISTQREIGKFIFNVPFYTSEVSIEPTPLPSTKETVTNFANNCRSSLGNALEATYEAPENGFDLDNSVNAIDGALDAIEDGINSVVGPIESALATARATVNNFRNKVTRIMQTATSFKNSITDVYNDILQLTQDPSSLAAAWLNLIDFNLGTSGTSSDIGPVDTVIRLRNVTNASVSDEQTRLNGLVGYYESLAYTTFNTDDDLNNALLIADNAFSRYIEQNDQGITSLSKDPIFRSNILQLRIVARESLNSQLSNIWRVEDITPGRTSMALTSFRYYGNLDNLGNIINLNPEVNVSGFDETIKTITR
jgi:prophage DNA circulation protein